MRRIQEHILYALLVRSSDIVLSVRYQATEQLDGRSRRRVEDARLAIRLLSQQGWASDHEAYEGRRAARYRAQRVMRALEDFKYFNRGELREKTWYQDDGWDPPGWRWAVAVRNPGKDLPILFDGRSQRLVGDIGKAVRQLHKHGSASDNKTYPQRRAARYRAQRVMRALEQFQFFEHGELTEKTWHQPDDPAAPGWRWAVIARNNQLQEHR